MNEETTQSSAAYTIPGPRSTQLESLLILIMLSAVFILSVIFSASSNSSEGQYFTICPLKLLAGLPCPFCGLAHSFCAIGKGDLKGGFEMNMLGPLLFALLILAWARSLCLLLGRQGFATVFDKTAKRVRLIRLLAIAFALYGAARLAFVLVLR